MKLSAVSGALLVVAIITVAACDDSSIPWLSSDESAVHGLGRPPRASAVRIADEEDLSDPLAGLERKLIRDARLTVEVQDVEDAVTQAASIAETQHGSVADSRITRSRDGYTGAAVTLRIPSDNFDLVMSDLKKLGTVRDESVHTRDITKAYTDLETRISVKTATKQRLSELLTRRTENLADVLAVERELARIVEELESMEGDKRYYDRHIAFSTITLDLYEESATALPGPLAPIRGALWHAVRTLSQSVATLVYIVVYLVPWLLVACLLWWVMRLLKRRRSR